MIKIEPAILQSGGVITGSSLTVTGNIAGSTVKLSDLTDGYVPYHINDTTGLADSPIYTDGAKVGINTASPGEKLSVAGGWIEAETNGYGIKFPDGSTQTSASGGGGGDISGAGTTGYLARYTAAKAIGDSVLYDDTNNIGLGISAFGTSADTVLGIGSGTAPTTSPANMVQLWSEDRSATHAQLHYRAESGVARPLIEPLNIKDYGCSSGATALNNRIYFQNAIDDLAAGGTLLITESFSVDTSVAEILVNKSMIIVGISGRTISLTSTGNTGLFAVSASNVLFDSLGLTGPDYNATPLYGQNGIHAEGTVNGAGVAPTFISNFKVRNCVITAFRGYGIKLDHVEDFNVTESRILQNTESDISLLGSRYGRIHHNFIGETHAYGVALTRFSEVEEIRYPRTRGVSVDHNTIKGMADHEGLDAHMAEDFVFDSNVILGCLHGIVLTGAKDENLDWGSCRNFTVTNNVINSLVTDGSFSAGIQIGISSPDLSWNMGTVANNIVIGHGTQAADPTADYAICAGYVFYNSYGLTISNNIALNCSPVGFNFAGANHGYTCSGNLVVAPWSNTAARGPWGFYFLADDSSGTLTGYTIIRGTLAGKTYNIDSGSGVGIFVGNNANQEIELGHGYNQGNIRLSDSGNRTTATFDTSVGIGMSPTYKLDVTASDDGGLAARFFNDGNGAGYYGIGVQAGSDDASGQTFYFIGYDGDGDVIGYLWNNNGTFELVDASDKKLKKNIRDTDIDATGIISKMKVRDFDKRGGNKTTTGFIAQELQSVYPAAVADHSFAGSMGVSKGALIPVLTKAIQELTERVKELENG